MVALQVYHLMIKLFLHSYTLLYKITKSLNCHIYI